jgi:sulfur relay (sulfurtransferase) DsrC/TusE family protein
LPDTSWTILPGLRVLIKFVAHRLPRSGINQLLTKSLFHPGPRKRI